MSHSKLGIFISFGPQCGLLAQRKKLNQAVAKLVRISSLLVLVFVWDLLTNRRNIDLHQNYLIKQVLALLPAL